MTPRGRQRPSRGTPAHRGQADCAPPTLDLEDRFREQGHEIVAGIDEAGRGPLAGPVVAAAVILPTGYAHRVLTDSKKLSAAQREKIYEELRQDERVSISFAFCTPEEIDRMNILRATHVAMSRAALGLTPTPAIVLIDGLPVPNFPLRQQAVVGGDALSLSIAAASIIAKVERDRMMEEFARQFPDYGFDRHKGYGTRDHLQKLRHHGPCPIHRRSFKPVAQLTLDFGE